MPVFEARVQVDPRVVDAWGISVARLSGARHAQDLEVANYISGKAAAWLKEAGATTTWPKLPGKGLSGGQHQAGTCRMGDDPKTSVVNRYCQVHDVANLFVVDGSVHVTNGGFNPALTIMAVAYMASEHIVQTWKGTRMRG
jgi:choline dehydrogenase-like flavoprotein